MTEKLPMTPRGWLKVDPTNAQVVMDYAGRTYLGDVKSAYYDDQTCTMRLKVNHFNGEAWSFDPPARSVNVLVRTYDQA